MPAAEPSDTAGAKPAGDETAENSAEVLSFRQAKAAAQMTELEQRMFRLSEALQALEPENSSRLMLGLKFAREELILHQMKETQALLDKLDLDEAVIEQKQLLAKLQRLHELLLSTDLDFQMQLERLRQIREILRQLEKAIVEEDREKKLSEDTAAKARDVERLRKKQADLDELIRREQAHLDEGRKLADRIPGDEKAAELPADDEQSLAALAKEQDATRTATQALAEQQAQPGQEPSPNLEQAQAKMGEATESLSQSLPAPAVPRQEEALAALQLERDRTARELERLEKELADAKFAAMRRDQEMNRQLNEGITELTRDLGESGAGALSELIRAGGAMSGAEGDLGDKNAADAAQEQEQALNSLKYAKEQLEDEAEKLLEQLRAEVKKRVLEGLTLMLQRQVAVREATEVLGPRVASGSRQALTSVVGLARSEGQIIDVATELLTLVEETEFGIALPAALLVVRESMDAVQASLADGDASEPVVEAERQIEADLAALLDAMKQMPSSKFNPNKPRKGPRDRERELNRLIAELKMIRLLQVRVNHQTVEVDGARPAELDALSASIRQQIEAVADHQDHVRDATGRLAEERGQELQGAMP